MSMQMLLGDTKLLSLPFILCKEHSGNVAHTKTEAALGFNLTKSVTSVSGGMVNRTTTTSDDRDQKSREPVVEGLVQEAYL